MSSSNSNMPSPVRERRRTLIACMNCRSRKLKCRPLEQVESAPCERCVKEGAFCEYRPVDSATPNHTSNYQDGPPVSLYHVPSTPLPNQDSTLSFNQSPYVPNQGGYVPNQIFNPATGMQAPFQQTYPPTPPFQHPSYHVTQYPPSNAYPSGYSVDQSNYQSSSQFGGGHPQYMYSSANGQANGPWDNQFKGYENMNGSNSARE